MNKLNNQTKGVIILIILALIGGGLYYFFVIRDEGVDIESLSERNVLIPYEDGNNVNEIVETVEEVKKIVVDVAGEVKKPGVIELDEGSRIKDAIELAGGVTNKADTSDMNLAYKLEDGMKIKVPSKKTKETNTEKSADTYVSTDAGTGVKTQESSTSDANNKTKVININTASQKELETLPGVGSATASKIIKYREEKGKFKKKEDIKNVSGIGDSKYEKLKDYIKV